MSTDRQFRIKLGNVPHARASRLVSWLIDVSFVRALSMVDTPRHPEFREFHFAYYAEPDACADLAYQFSRWARGFHPDITVQVEGPIDD